VLAVVRHGDRTPKQKMKMKVTQVRRAVLLCCRLTRLVGASMNPGPDCALAVTRTCEVAPCCVAGTDPRAAAQAHRLQGQAGQAEEPGRAAGEKHARL
jgi:hypothetical protein